MDSGRWPSALRQRLGNDGAAALADVLEDREEVMLTLATERFERRLSEECSKLRSDMFELRGELRADTKVFRSELSAEIASCRADLIKWAFVFWVGQLAAMTAMLTMLR